MIRAALTTLLLAQLVDEGKLRWDTPVSEALPGVRIGSEATTRAMQIKHLVCACTGLPRQDWDWIIEFGQSTPNDLLRSPRASSPRLSSARPSSTVTRWLQRRATSQRAC